MTAKERVAQLRIQMEKEGVTAYLVPSADNHQNEYVPTCWRRRAYLSGFTGSAGDVVVTKSEARLWTDGRYFLQAAIELRGSGVRLMKIGQPGVPTINEYLARQLNAGESVGVDPRVITIERAKAIETALAPIGAHLEMVDPNLVDAIWPDRPAPSDEPVRLHPKRFAGESVASKLRRVRKAMREKKAGAHVLSSLDAIAWLYNIRGRDVEYNPLLISYALLTHEKAFLFVDHDKVPANVTKKLAACVTLRPYEEITSALENLAAEAVRVWVDGSTTSRWIGDFLAECPLITDPSPVTVMKAKKNEIEIEGMRSAHVRDGVAMVRFLRWLENEVRSGGVTELSAAERLEQFRSEGTHYQGLSFQTISGYAGNGAIIHYGTNEQNNAPLKAEGIYLIDSGGQYLDGTTDITRSVLLGKRVSQAIKDRFTRVLKGHIALASVGFPSGSKGGQLDLLARLPLWEIGLNYNHGTGHGVGAHLCVHEGPQGIGPGRDTKAALEPGNILSNEPGFYEMGRYGLRTENLIVVVKDPKLSKKGAEWLRFETITYCPIDRRLIVVGLLTDSERKWLNSYHKTVYWKLSPHLDREDRAWLKGACAPV